MEGYDLNAVDMPSLDAEFERAVRRGEVVYSDVSWRSDRDDVGGYHRSSGEEQLFDLLRDSGELRSIHDESTSRQTLAQHRKAWSAGRARRTRCTYAVQWRDD